MRSETEKAYKERILRVLVHIQGHLDAALSLDDLAAIATFSPYHFHRVFRGMVGESVMEHVRRLRLERAALRLKIGDQPVTEIAFDAGYETVESFTRAFGAMFGEAPSRYRKARQARLARAVPSGVHFAPDGRVDDFRSHRSEGEPLRARIESTDAMRVVFIRHRGPYDQCAAAWQSLMAWAAPRRLLGPGTIMLGVPHDDPEVTPPDKLRYDACLAVDKDVAAEGDVGIQSIAGGEYVCAAHRGPIDGIGETYARLFGEWLPSSGREPRPLPCYEIYRNFHPMTPPEDLWTDVHLPLEPV